MSKNYIQIQINNNLSIIKEAQNTINKLQLMEKSFDDLSKKYQYLTASPFDKNYNFYANINNYNYDLLIIKYDNHYRYKKKITDKETGFDIYSLETGINGKDLFSGELSSNECDNEAPQIYEIYFYVDLESLSKEFKDPDSVLSIFKSNLIKMINNKSKVELVFTDFTDSNSKIIESIKQNLIFT